MSATGASSRTSCFPSCSTHTHAQRQRLRSGSVASRPPGTEDGGVASELLGGCVDAVTWLGANDEREDDDGRINAEPTTRLNAALTAKKADHVLTTASHSATVHANLDALSEKRHAGSLHGRALAYLVARALLNRLTGEHWIRIDRGGPSCAAV